MEIVFDNAPPPGWSVIANTQPYRQMHGVWGWVCLESTQPFYYRKDRKCARSRVTVGNCRHELSLSSPLTIKRDHSFIELEGRKMRDRRIGGIQVFSFPSPRPVYPCYAASSEVPSFLSPQGTMITLFWRGVILFPLATQPRSIVSGGDILLYPFLSSLPILSHFQLI